MHREGSLNLKRHWGFLGVSVIFSGKHISFYALFKVTVARVIYCLKGAAPQIKFLVWCLHSECFGLIIRTPDMKFLLTSVLGNQVPTIQWSFYWNQLWADDVGMAGGNLHAGQGEILFGSARKAFCVTPALQVPQSCIVKSSLSYNLLKSFQLSHLPGDGMGSKVSVLCCDTALNNMP